MLAAFEILSLASFIIPSKWDDDSFNELPNDVVALWMDWQRLVRVVMSLLIVSAFVPMSLNPVSSL